MQVQQYDDGSQLLAATRAQDAHAFIVNIKQRLQDLRGQADVVWSGGAAAVFKQVVDEWSIQFDQVITSLDRIATSLKDSDLTYQQSQMAADDLTSQLKAALNGDATASI